MAKNSALTSLLHRLPKRSKVSNKTDGGRVLIVAGGAKLMGAGLLSALAATRSGAGYTHLMTDLVHYPWLKFPDFILHKFSLVELKKHENSTVAMGPGLGVSADKGRLLNYLITKKFPQVILDADALTLLSQLKLKNKKLPSSWILTPHEGELARLLQVSAAKVKSDRQHYLELAHQKYGCIVLLKGAETLIISDEGTAVVSTGTKALAKAGTGDVLLGVIAAFYAQGLTPVRAAILGSMVHGMAANDWEKRGNDHLGLRPMDLVDQIPKTIKRLRKVNGRK